MKDLKIDPARRADFREDSTGIFVRAQDADGKWVNADILHLDRDSVIVWLRSRGGNNLWAENTVLLLLQHEPFANEDEIQKDLATKGGPNKVLTQS